MVGRIEAKGSNTHWVNPPGMGTRRPPALGGADRSGRMSGL